MTTPILHVGVVGGCEVRFFRSPLAGPDMPWHSTDDLHRALGFPRDLRRHFKRQLQGEWKADVRTIATASGITTIAPHFMAQGLIDAAAPYAPPGVFNQYAEAGAAAMQEITKHMGPAAGVQYAISAFNGQGRTP